MLLATGADVIAVGSNGERAIPITEFIVDFFGNSLADDEMVTEVRIPVPSGTRRFVPEARAQGRRLHATVADAAHLDARGRRHHRGAGLALTAVNPVNTKVTAAEEMLVGRQPTTDAFVAAGELAAQASSRATTCAAQRYGSATSCGCSPVGPSPPPRPKPRT